MSVDYYSSEGSGSLVEAANLENERLAVESALQVEIIQLKLTVKDLNRRLENAQLTIDAERSIARTATAQAETYRQKLGELSKFLRLEGAKAYNLEQKALHHLESQRFESNKERASKLHEDLRLLEVDHMMTGMKREPLKLTKMRSKLQSLEKAQESQKGFLQELVESDAVSEQLSVAAQMGDLQQCSRLLRCGAWPNYIDSAGYLALHYAASNGFYDVAQLLLEFGADVSSYLTGHSPVVLAAANGHIGLLKLLLQFGADVEDTGKAHTPATIAALCAGFFDVVEFLLSHGADVNSFDADENTILHHAVRLRDQQQAQQLIDFLLQCGSSTERVNKRGHTALQTALYEKRRGAIIALGGDPYATATATAAADVNSSSHFRTSRGLPPVSTAAETQSNSRRNSSDAPLQLGELSDADVAQPSAVVAATAVSGRRKEQRHGTPATALAATRSSTGTVRNNNQQQQEATTTIAGSSSRRVLQSQSQSQLQRASTSTAAAIAVVVKQRAVVPTSSGRTPATAATTTAIRKPMKSATTTTTTVTAAAELRRFETAAASSSVSAEDSYTMPGGQLETNSVISAVTFDPQPREDR